MEGGELKGGEAAYVSVVGCSGGTWLFGFAWNKGKGWEEERKTLIPFFLPSFLPSHSRSKRKGPASL